MLRRLCPVLLAPAFTPIYMPALSPSMETGKVLEWKAKVGDKITIGTTWMKLETDKAAVDFDNTSEEGFLAKTYAKAGDVVTVGRTIGVIVEDEADVGKGDEYVVQDAAEEAPAPAAAAPTPAAAQPSAAAPVPYYGGSVDAAVSASGPGVIRVANSVADRAALAKVAPSGKGGRFLKSDLAQLPGFDYENSNAAAAAAAATTTAIAGPVTSSAPPSAATDGAAASAALSVRPVHNFSTSDTQLLNHLFGNKKVAEKKAAAAGNGSEGCSAAANKACCNSSCCCCCQRSSRQAESCC